MRAPRPAAHQQANGLRRTAEWRVRPKTGCGEAAQRDASHDPELRSSEPLSPPALGRGLRGRVVR